MIPNYTKIYLDIINEKFPEKLNDDKIIEKLCSIHTTTDVITINEYLFENKAESSKDNQQLKSYDKKTILKILSYQKKHNLSNTSIAQRYKMSRNTIIKWKKVYEIETLNTTL